MPSLVPAPNLPLVCRPTALALVRADLAQTYVLKLARSGEDGDKVLLLIESGVRYHTVEVGWGKGQTTAGVSMQAAHKLGSGF